jgi:hypothetical protein
MKDLKPLGALYRLGQGRINQWIFKVIQRRCPIAKGGYRPGAGRKPGIPSKLKQGPGQGQAIPVEIKGMTPAEYLASVVEDVTADPGLRIQAARALSPYCHKKQPEALEHTVNVPIAVQIVTPLTK